MDASAADMVGEFDELELREVHESKGKEAWESEDEGDAAGGGSGGAGPGSDCGSEPGDLTCAICLANIPLEELAMVKGCDHMYCVNCILQWALHKEQPWCPQCKSPFDYLLTYRTLDGTLQDFPCEESVVLLKRARWFEDHMRATEKGKALLEDSRLAEDTAWQDWADDYDLASDEEIEAFYYSSAAGRARVVFGNRRFGEGGYISGGRRQARATAPVPRGKHNSGKGGKSGENAVLTPPAAAAAPAPSFRTPNAGGGRKAGAPSASHSISVPGASPGAGGRGSDAAGSAGASGSGCAFGGGASPSGSRAIYGSSPCGSAGLYGSSPAGSGRRARRNARRAAQDYNDAYAY